MLKRFFAISMAMIMLVGSVVFAGATDITKDEWDPKNQSYDEYFKNEHGFYSDEVTKSHSYLNYKTGIFNTLVQKSGTDISFQGKKVTGIIGNSEVTFFAVDNTVYRYHVKSKRVDKLFTEPMMESFYPITSDKIMWKKATSINNARASLSDRVISTGNYYIYSVKNGENTATSDPEYSIALTQGLGYTNMEAGEIQSAVKAASQTRFINNKSVPIMGYLIGSYYSGTTNGSSQCRGFSWLVYNYLWGSYSYGYQVLTGTTASSADALYNLASYYGPGSRFNFTGPLNSPDGHSMIITYVSDGVIEVYHANWNNSTADDNLGRYIVRVTQFTKAQFYSYFKYFQHAQVPHL